MFQREGVRVRHTVRRSPRGVEQAGPRLDPALRAARIAGSGAASGAAPGWLGLRTTRIPHKVPERGTDSGP
ncbi:hypothetical protein FGD71_027400 [Streptomyces sporangiiformans]|uniref:Uncharacterized protein n=1 Tax=Streptomyces sporangiiformans TaxID=2315329 RepID=A0A505DK44_9ACTN|nr:hypothetical protein FGD71_027400 [Streptomyces sporangiiformans]